MIGSVPLTKLEGAKPIPMVDVVARIDYLRRRQSEYKTLLVRNRTDPDYCAELAQELSEIDRLIHALDSLSGLKSTDRHAQYNFACSIEVRV